MGQLTLLLGGARSGKSRRALALAEEMPGPHIFVATAQAYDAEMEERISLHQAERDARWTTIEAPLNLPEAFAKQSQGTLVIDCCTIWLSNIMLADRGTDAAMTALIDALGQAEARLILVSNEVGSGVVPEHALGRRFRDEQGRLNQRLAEICDRVELVVAGIPLTLKQPKP
ncbi:bifunctional adenosylcobinamide kinase/adenosylcobinamide-phosphate guanylyltransferase [Qipengyuania sp. GH1]|uniref:bifunctional adenosylcobinamide kinase/adenosylcobinamide-phosphate guanylyltransferase n=1 Tax=Qipengyuania aestuarii TaxID=2867241 RepID=UPI001C883EE2|nr:bifunctional adenosylcobinamide kinase/adenosylcobinamide-phosphate guanylyltransferase [Qipengyuania aestuarii]MBX7534959.1 bifunctional adenosylcobinamide kinase/adenosylcobinamide-phosphate guanylyltransferase [Qipengyuania aestuarii]